MSFQKTEIVDSTKSPNTGGVARLDKDICLRLSPIARARLGCPKGMYNQSAFSRSNLDPCDALSGAVGSRPIAIELADGEIFQGPNSRLVFKPADLKIALS